MNEIVALRQQLHQFPDVSGDESATAEIIKAYLNQYPPDVIHENVGGTGILAIYHGNAAGKLVTFRCELDALPIAEINEDIDYKSTNEGISHKCGHDGHMAIVCSLASHFYKNRPESGSIMLLFQPAEETGKGAQQMLDDKRFNNFNPDYIFALHNLPKYPFGKVLIKNDVFAAASKGLICKLEGTTSHAATPESGNSPAEAMAEIMLQWKSLNNESLNIDTFSIVTVVHASLGAEAFGVSPGDAVVMATLRSFSDEDLTLLEDTTKTIATDIAAKYDLKLSFSEEEVFKSTLNDSTAVELIENAAKANGYELDVVDQPFKWSEDFGVFTHKWRGAMFGLGAGDNIPDLHNPDYDFPDELIENGSNMFITIANNILNGS